MEAGFVLELPAYTLLLKDGTGTLLLKHGEDLWLPLFTDEDAVQTYVERAALVDWCLIHKLKTAGALRDFLQNPPSRSGSCDVSTVVIDPIDPQLRGVTLLAVKNILASIPPNQGA